MRGEILFLSVLTIVGSFALLFPLARALAARLRPQVPVPDPAIEAIRDEMLQELQLVRREVAELGERVDFTERLLAKQRAAGQLGPGPGV